MALTKKDISLLSEHFVTNSGFDFRLEELEKRLKEKIRGLPTKDEFYVSMDKLMGKLEKIEQELILTPSHSDLADLEERIMPLEEIHPGGKHLTLQP